MHPLSPDRMDRVRVYADVTSTNELLLQMARDGAPDGQVILSDAQSAGRGRAGRGFVSPPGMGIYLSYLVRPDQEKGESLRIEDWLPLTACTAVAVADAITEVFDVTPDIKWVNDLLLHDKKICGILVQSDLDPQSGDVRGMVIGIGVNVWQRPEDFPEELRETATSIGYEVEKAGATVRHGSRPRSNWNSLRAGCAAPVAPASVEPRAVRPGPSEDSQEIFDPDRRALAAAIIRHLDVLRENFITGRFLYLASYRARCIPEGKTVRVIDGAGMRNAETRGISDEFGLIVRYEDGQEDILTSGEISIRYDKA